MAKYKDIRPKLTHPYYRKMYKALKGIAAEYFGGYSIRMPSISSIMQMCDTTNAEWFIKTLGVLEKNGYITKMWTGKEWWIEIMPC